MILIQESYYIFYTTYVVIEKSLTQFWVFQIKTQLYGSKFQIKDFKNYCYYFFCRSLDRNEYNHITATYFLLAERKLRMQRIQKSDLIRGHNQVKKNNINSNNDEKDGAAAAASTSEELSAMASPPLPPIQMSSSIPPPPS